MLFRSLNTQTPLTLLALLLVPLLAYAIYRTPAGLALRMVGERSEERRVGKEC